MIRISRLTDYGIVLMRHMAAHPDRAHNASELAAGARLPAPTVSKLLRQLAREGLLESQRGVKGGYTLARPSEEISVAAIISALEGPIALTDCAAVEDPDCAHEPVCPVRSHWNRISQAIRDALEGVSLAEMAAPMKPRFMRVMPNATASGAAAVGGGR
jgi:FeS assembly SUF system regulator